ncbi:PfkB family carbohydrate kinase [Methanosarcina sp. UBA411]|jgi:rfaE bifunctional protein kinase chain/domain|uniref:PfkB family carbohydrate kinase n=1 Tax=Methanosarcina sp. UBA411 TaxID=1915589 RepID=UPI0025E3E2F7|nr:PfkB family carbohydrate kinase [Methanosarcina sp. UBA411]
MLELFLPYFFNACVSGFIGNRADATAVSIAQKIAQQFEDRKIINNDVQKALNRSFQLSLKSICNDCLSKVKHEITYKKSNPQLLDNRKWLENKKLSIEKELEEVETKDYEEPTTKVLEEIKFLLVQGDLATEKFQNFKVKLIERAIGKDTTPECYRKSVENSILRLMCNNFAYEIKNNRDISILFMQLLVQYGIKIDAIFDSIPSICEKLDRILESSHPTNKPKPKDKKSLLVKRTKRCFKILCEECRKKDKKILVVGDVMLDYKVKAAVAKYEDVQKHQITSEGGEVYMISEECKALGGAADIAMAFSEISKVTLIGVIGSDCEGRTLKKLGYDHNIQFNSIEASEVKTTTKIYIHRITEKGAKKVIRFDSEDIKLMTSYCYSENVQSNLISKIKKYVTEIDCIVIKDHQKGMVTEEVINKIAEIAENNQVPLYVDPKYAWEKFGSVMIEAILPNIKEAASALYDINKEDGKILDRDIHYELEDIEYIKLVKNYPNCKNFVIKASKKGAVIVSQNAEIYPRVINPLLINKRDFETDVGCGDVFDAFLIIGMLNGHTIEECVLFANFVAGLKTKKSLGEHISLQNIINEMDQNKNGIKNNPFEQYVEDNSLLVNEIIKSSIED